MKTDTDLSLVEQVNLEKEMGTYSVRFTTVKELKAFWDIVDTDISQCNLTCFCLVWPVNLFPVSSVLLVVLYVQLYSALDRETDAEQDPSYTRTKG